MRKIFATAPGHNVARVYKSEGEFIARLYVQGMHYEPADYFTDNRDDAVSTALLMAKQAETMRINKLGQLRVLADIPRQWVD